MHRENHGKLEMASKIPLTTRDELSTAYTPGVAAPCLKIKEDKSEAYTYTAKGNLVAVVTDGTAVLGPVSYTHLDLNRLRSCGPLSSMCLTSAV